MMTLTKRPAELDEKIDKVLQLMRYDKYLDALKEAKVLAESYPEIGPVYGLLSVIYFELERFEEAAEYFKKTTILSPKSEMASLGLFHSLWQLKRYDESFDEMKRYMAISVSEEYNELAKNLDSAKY